MECGNGASIERPSGNALARSWFLWRSRLLVTALPKHENSCNANYIVIRYHIRPIAL